MNRKPCPPVQRSTSQRHSAGISLVEVLIGVALTGMALAATAKLAVSHVGIARSALTASETQRGFNKVSYLLANEISESCVIRLLPTSTDLTTFEASLNTSANYTYPATACRPATRNSSGTWVPVCQGDNSNGVLSLVIPVLDPAGGNPVHRIIQYRLTPNTPADGFSSLTRIGPAVEASGRLSTTASNTSIVSQRMLAFTPTLTVSSTAADSCRSLTIAMQMNSASAPRSLRLRSRVAESL